MNPCTPHWFSFAALMSLTAFPYVSFAADPTAPAAAQADDFPPTVVHSPGAPAASPNRASEIERPLRYRPENGDFVIDNGTARFNRPLYGYQTAFRIEAGDRPEFGLATPRKGGVLRIGISTTQGRRWLTDAAHVRARYRPGSMVYEVRDALLGEATLSVAVLPTKDAEGLVLRAELSGETTAPVELVFLFGGASNEAINNRNGDIMGGRDNAEKWELLPADCAGQTVTASEARFELHGKAGVFAGTLSAGEWSVGDATTAARLNDALTSVATDAHPIAIGRTPLTAGTPVFLALQRSAQSTPVARTPLKLKEVFAAAEAYRRDVVNRVVVNTPDEFVNAMPAAMAISGDALWAQSTVMHGNNAWRMPLLGWRGQYVLNSFGWHDRAREHFRLWISRQNTDPTSIPPAPRADPEKNLATDDWRSLHSFGGIPARHYDMSLGFVDALLRHIEWTGDREFAREIWPFLTRHLAWEKRNFDRGGLYEAYAAIWASDGLTYNGGGAAHSTAYNYLHNTLAARIARWIGEDSTPYETEAKRIHEAMQRELWLEDRGWYAEYREYQGLKRAHPAAALWTVYHTIDSRVPDPFQAYRTLRYVDTHLARIPVRGPGVPKGDWFTVPSTNWVPYEWSLNNVYLGETGHTALAYWQGGRADVAWRLWKGTLLDSMFMGLNPGSMPNLSQYDVYRRETYRDFGDSTGVTARSLVEGLFGIAADGIDGELRITPGYPADWEHASIRTPDIEYAFKREGRRDTYTIEWKRSDSLALRLRVPAISSRVESVEVNGKPATWKSDGSAIGRPRLIVEGPAAARSEVVIRWSGDAIAPEPESESVGVPANFEQVRRGDFGWWRPVAPAPAEKTVYSFTQYTAPEGARFEPVNLDGLFNDKITQIFRNEYLSPRSPHVSLSMPKQGIGSWSAFSQMAEIDDSGLRRLAAENGGTIRLPSGVPVHTPAAETAKNTAFVSYWDNYPTELSAPLSGRARNVILLVAGSTTPMHSHIDNGEVVVSYADGSTARLALHNPTTWWPIEQDYMIDDYAFRREAPVPLRVELKTGRMYVPSGYGPTAGGAATALSLPLDPNKELRSLTIRALSTEVVIGLLGATLIR